MDESETGSTHLRWMGPTLGDEFPDLRGETQDSKKFSLYEYFGDSWGIVFMHPADFTPVCTTEIGAAQSLIDEFTIRDVKLCGFSCDDASRHRAWLDDIEAATGQRISFPLFCDATRMHAIELGVFDPALKDHDGLPLTVRSVFIINPKKEITLTMTYPASVGRNFDEILRVCDALQRADKYRIATPANWHPGDKAIVSYDLDDKAAVDRFGENGFTTVNLPSENGKQLSRHYLRYTDDPVLSSNSRKSFKLAIRMTKPKMSWRPPKSFALTLSLPRKRRDQASSNEFVVNENRRLSDADMTGDNSSTIRDLSPVPILKEEATRSSVDYSNHRPWKSLLRHFTSGLKNESTHDKSEVPVDRRSPSSGNEVSASPEKNIGSELLVGFGETESKGDGPVVW